MIELRYLERSLLGQELALINNGYARAVLLVDFGKEIETGSVGLGNHKVGGYGGEMPEAFIGIWQIVAWCLSVKSLPKDGYEEVSETAHVELVGLLNYILVSQVNIP